MGEKEREKQSDYYAILTLSPSADQITIKRTYKRLALLRHPDRNGGVNATVEFQLLQEAYSVLSDTGRRNEYDRTYDPGKVSVNTNTKRPPARPPASPHHETQGESNLLLKRRALESQLRYFHAEKVKQNTLIQAERNSIHRLESEVLQLEKEYNDEEQKKEKETWINGYLNGFFSPSEEQQGRERQQLDRGNALRIRRVRLEQKKGDLGSLETVREGLNGDIERVSREMEGVDIESRRRRAEEAETRAKKEMERRRRAEEMIKQKKWAAETARRREAEEKRHAEDLQRNMQSFFESIGPSASFSMAT